MLYHIIHYPQYDDNVCSKVLSKGKAANGVPHPLPCHHVSRNCNM